MKNNENNSKKFKSPIELATFYAASKFYKLKGNPRGTYRNLMKLKPLYHKKASYHFDLYQLAYQQNLIKEALNHINNAIKLSKNKTPFKYDLAKIECLLELNKIKDAKLSLDRLLKADFNLKTYAYRLAHVYDKLGNKQEAIKTYKLHLHNHPNDFTANLDLANCYYLTENYENAAKKYEIIKTNFNSNLKEDIKLEVYYKLGVSQLESGHVSDADQTFDELIKIDTKMNSDKLGIGVFHQLYENYDHAIKAYKSLLSSDDENAELLFKIASTLELQDRILEAIVYYEKALDIDQVNANWHYKLAHCYTKLEEYENAAKYYKSAVERSLNHSATMYRYLAESLFQINKPEQALSAYRKALMFHKPVDVSQTFYKNNIVKENVRYGMCYEMFNVDENKIFYSSMSGAGMIGNPYAIFKNLIQNEKYKDFTHVWLINNFSNIPKKYRKMKNIIFVKKGTDAYYKHQTSAKYLVCNSTFEPYVIRKPNQYYLQTSHGIFYKTVGRDSSNSPFGVAGATRNLLQATHIIFPNDYMANKQPKSYSIAGIYAGEAAKVGYPRIDLTLNLNQKDKEILHKKVKSDINKKTVFYAPTWRGDGKANNRFDSEKLIHDLEELAKLNANIVFRGHPITDVLLKNVDIPANILVPPRTISSNELLGISDIVISDYSSVFFDFIVTEKPIIHYLYDLKQYKSERGLNLTEDELPGQVAKTIEELVKAIENKLTDPLPDKKYLQAKERFSTYDDGNSAKKVVQWFIEKDSSQINLVEENRLNKSYLFLGGEFTNLDDLPNLISHMDKLQKEGHKVSLMFRRKGVQDKERSALISKLNKNINLLVQDQKMSLTLQEAYAIYYHKKHHSFKNNIMKDRHEQAYEKQARRLLGDSSFDEIINFEKDSTYWTSLEQALKKGHLINE